MRIGVIGVGNIGATAAELFIKAGHEVAIANSRGPETLQDLIVKQGNRAKAVSVEEAARFGEIVLVAIPFGQYKTLPAETLHGKIGVYPPHLTRNAVTRCILYE